MKLTRALFCALIGLAMLSSLPAQEGPPEHGKKENVTELGQWMDKMGSAFRKLRRQITTPEANASSRELMAVMIDAATHARELTPEKTAEIPEADREKYVAAYREKMDELLGKLRDIDAAFAANDNAKADQLVRELRGIQREGHKEYKTDRD